ncbi:hypothetical protein PVK06_041472 [Gossypium arboreum]|uniref:CCHC-type domain-containing protein n=1 Tax=Gossypium arboreum TaxID=29729 RepID=A0ABR0N8A8_GOSAR|nr:hypothetical protein PVK06_041472 [Gossypium arboreum]
MEQETQATSGKWALKKVWRQEEDPSDVGDQGAQSEGGFHSFKTALANGNLNGEDKEDYENDDFVLNEGDIIMSTIDGMPDIRFSDRVHTLVLKSMFTSVIIKSLGRKIGLNSLCSKLYAIWKPTRTFQLMDLVNDYYVVKFEAKMDYKKVLAEGTQEEYPMLVVVWVRLPNFPGAWFKRCLLEAVGNTIGQVVKVDDNIENGAKGRFARMALRIEDKIQREEYENLPNVCYECGRFGHVKDGCPKLNVQKEMEENDEEEMGWPKSLGVKLSTAVEFDRKAKSANYGSIDVQKEHEDLNGLRKIGRVLRRLMDLSPNLERTISENRVKLD